jgi:uncharacterized membrane protein
MLLSAYIISKLRRSLKVMNKFLDIFLLYLVCLVSSWWTYQSPSIPKIIWDVLLNIVKEVVAPLPVSSGVLTLQEKISAILALGLRYILALITIVGGIILYFKTRKTLNYSQRQLFAVGLSLSVLFPALFALTFGKLKFESYTYLRFADYALVFAPIFAWPLFAYIERVTFQKSGSAWRKRILLAFTIMILFASLLSIYPISPIIPKKPAPIVVYDYNSVNTIYRVKAIEFLDNSYVSGAIKTRSYNRDTLWQVAGFARSLYDKAIYATTSHEITFDILQLGSEAGAYTVTEESFLETQFSIEHNEVIYSNGACLVALNRTRG